MDTPPSIRWQYASPPRELAEQRRKRLANRRAAKYRHFRSLTNASGPAATLQREQNTRRQRERRSLLDDEARDRLRTQNRRRQQLWRQSLSDRDKTENRLKQRERQRKRRQRMDEDAREKMRERARLRIGRRRRQLKRQQEIESTLLPLLPPSVADNEQLSLLRLAPELPTLKQHQELQRQREMPRRLPFGGSDQVTLPPPPPDRVRTLQLERIPSLPHFQQVTRPATSTLLPAPSPPALFPMPGPLPVTSGGMRCAAASLPTVSCVVAAVATRPPHPTPIMPSVSLPLPAKALVGLPLAFQKQPLPRTPIVLPPAHRSLPPLPDFLSSREVFNPLTAAASARITKSANASRTLFPSTDLPALHSDAQDWDFF